MIYMLAMKVDLCAWMLVQHIYNNTHSYISKWTGFLDKIFSHAKCTDISGIIATTSAREDMY